MSKLKAAQALAFPGGKLEFIDEDHVCFLHGNCVAVAKVDAPERVEFLTHAFERGVSASEAQRDAVDAAAKALEARNPNRACLRSPAARALLSGEWELLYTTSASILGATRPWPFRPLGPIFQTIDVDRLRARNRETFPFFNAVDADLTPASASAVDVQFVTCYVFGFIEVTAPASARGALDVTYLDEELRVSRGDRGNLFVLRMADDAKRLPRKGDV